MLGIASAGFRRRKGFKIVRDRKEIELLEKIIENVVVEV